MFTPPDLMQAAAAKARHSAAQQAVHARNIAHADTPGYQARRLPPFAEAYAQDHGALRATRPRHLHGTAPRQLPEARIDPAPATRKPNGNTVSLEQEMVLATRTSGAHEWALSIYSTARNILRTSIGRGA